MARLHSSKAKATIRPMVLIQWYTSQWHSWAPQSVGRELGVQVLIRLLIGTGPMREKMTARTWIAAETADSVQGRAGQVRKGKDEHQVQQG
jgi:hypothetical protein